MQDSCLPALPAVGLGQTGYRKDKRILYLHERTHLFTKFFPNTTVPYRGVEQTAARAPLLWPASLDPIT